MSLEGNVHIKEHDMSRKQNGANQEDYDSSMEVLRKSNPFRELGLYYHQDISLKYFTTKNFGIPENQNYCDVVDVYNLLDSERWLKERIYFTEYGFANTLLYVKHMLRRHGIETPSFDKRRALKKYFKTHYFPYNISTVIPFFQDYFYLGGQGINHLCKTFILVQV